jgi:hypothetical protein
MTCFMFYKCFVQKRKEKVVTGKYLYILLASAQDQKDSIVGKYEIIPARIGKLCLKGFPK